LSLSKYVKCAEMKKLMYRIRKNSGLSINNPLTIEQKEISTIRASKTEGCAVCKRNFNFMLRRTCEICQRRVCSSCSEKKLVCVLAPDRRTVLDKKRTFCTMCLCQATESDAVAIAQNEIRELHPQFETQPQDSETTSDALIVETSTRCVN
ncbi:hypothetical protein PHMEG_00023066, partial [Phytophthora megakarya]